MSNNNNNCCNNCCPTSGQAPRAEEHDILQTGCCAGGGFTQCCNTQFVGDWGQVRTGPVAAYQGQTQTINHSQIFQGYGVTEQRYNDSIAEVNKFMRNNFWIQCWLTCKGFWCATFPLIITSVIILGFSVEGKVECLEPNDICNHGIQYSPLQNYPDYQLLSQLPTSDPNYIDLQNDPNAVEKYDRKVYKGFPMNCCTYYCCDVPSPEEFPEQISEADDDGYPLGDWDDDFFRDDYQSNYRDPDVSGVCIPIQKTHGLDCMCRRGEKNRRLEFRSDKEIEENLERKQRKNKIRENKDMLNQALNNYNIYSFSSMLKSMLKQLRNLMKSSVGEKLELEFDNHNASDSALLTDLDDAELDNLDNDNNDSNYFTSYPLLRYLRGGGQKTEDSCGTTKLTGKHDRVEPVWWPAVVGIILIILSVVGMPTLGCMCGYYQIDQNVPKIMRNALSGGNIQGPNTQMGGQGKQIYDTFNNIRVYRGQIGWQARMRIGLPIVNPANTNMMMSGMPMGGMPGMTGPVMAVPIGAAGANPVGAPMMIQQQQQPLPAARGGGEIMMVPGSMMQQPGTMQPASYDPNGPQVMMIPINNNSNAVNAPAPTSDNPFLVAAQTGDYGQGSGVGGANMFATDPNEYGRNPNDYKTVD